MVNTVGQFGLEERRVAPLLVASISESANRNLKLPSLRLPLPELGIPGAVNWPAAKGKHKDGSMFSGPLHSPRSEVAQARRNVQQVAAVIGGVLLAGLSKVAQHVAKAQPPKSAGSLPFHQSFSFPWDNRKNYRESSRESEALARNLLSRGREYERALDVRAAVQCFDEAARLAPNSLVTLCLAAKQWSDLTFYYDVRSDRERQLVNLKALEYADKAITHHPDNAGGYLSACISKGRLALFCDNRTKVRLAKEAQDAAATALRLGPENDLAHHLMGRWHYEMSKLNVVVRTVVRVMYGTSLTPGTREEALAAYRRAIELAPHRLVHHVEAGRIALELGDSEAARESLKAALQCEVEDINAWHTRMDAEMLLAQMDRRPWKQPSLVPPGIRGATPASLSTMALLEHSGTQLRP